MYVCSYMCVRAYVYSERYGGARYTEREKDFYSEKTVN